MIQTLIDRLRPERRPVPAADPIRRFRRHAGGAGGAAAAGGGGRMRALDLFGDPLRPFARSPS
jgi:hypothetical protein